MTVPISKRPLALRELSQVSEDKDKLGSRSFLELQNRRVITVQWECNFAEASAGPVPSGSCQLLVCTVNLTVGFMGPLELELGRQEQYKVSKLTVA